MNTELLREGLLALDLLLLMFVSAASIVRLIQLARAAVRLRAHMRTLRCSDARDLSDDGGLTPVSLILVARGADGADAVERLLKLEYGEYEVVAAADGEALARLKARLGLLPFSGPYRRSLDAGEVRSVYCSPRCLNLTVLDTDCGDRAYALNAAVNVARFPLLAVTDCEALLTNDALVKLLRPFFDDPYCVAAYCAPRVCGEGAFAMGEYLASLASLRLTFGALRLIPARNDAVCAFTRSAVIEAGGFVRGCRGACAELTLRLHMLMRDRGRRYSVEAVRDPVCYIRAAGSLRAFLMREKRLSGALRDALRRNPRITLDPAYGRVGAVCVPYYRYIRTACRAAEALGFPLIAASLAFGIVEPRFLIVYAALVLLGAAAPALSALLIEELAFGDTRRR